MKGRLLPLAALVGLLVAIVCAVGIPVRASPSGQTDVDEPQYLMTAQSLWYDGDLDITDQLAERSWRDFHRPGTIDVQTVPLPDGTTLSPHDPLLPLMLAVPVGLGGWVGAKLFLCLLAGLTAALTLWTGVRRFGLPLRRTAVVVAVAGTSTPMVVYGQQVYPEMPAALATVGAVALLTAASSARRTVGLVVCLTALPWLSVKYVPVAVGLAGVAAWRWWRAGERRDVLVAGGVLVAMAAAYAVVHRMVYGGWTVYGVGDEFQAGELGVVGFRPDFPARSVRLLGLVLDADYGLASWQPAALAVFAGIGWGLRRRLGVLLWPVLGGWLVATYVAVTMQGFWWPGRQLVVVGPLLALLVAGWVATLRRPALGVLGVLTAWGLAIQATVLVAGYRRTAWWAVSGLDDGLHRPWSSLLPDLRVLAGAEAGSLPLQVASYVAWTLLALALTWSGWRSAAPPPGARGATSRCATQESRGLGAESGEGVSRRRRSSGRGGG